MKRLWGKLYIENKLVGDTAVELHGEMDEADMFVDLMKTSQEGLKEICSSFDIENPIWLDMNVSQFMRREKTKFRADNFMDTIDFDYLEIEIIDEK